LSRRDPLRLQDIRDAIGTIKAHLDAGSFDRKTSDAILYNLVVIGEASNQLSDEVRAAEPDVPWSEIVGLRNLVTHEYFRIDLEIIETIVRERLNDLDLAVARLLRQSEAEGI
jgi:uncharacterized protein with HEPN domain